MLSHHILTKAARDGVVTAGFDTSAPLQLSEEVFSPTANALLSKHLKSLSLAEEDDIYWHPVAASLLAGLY